MEDPHEIANIRLTAMNYRTITAVEKGKSRSVANINKLCKSNYKQNKKNKAMKEDLEFIEKIHEVAQSVKGSSLTSTEKEELIKIFNSEIGTAFQRARISIEKCIGKEIPDSFPLFEKAYSSTNNLQNLLNELRTVAETWSKLKK